MEPKWISVIPPLLAVVLAFITRDAAVSLALACLSGVLIMGQGLMGFPALLTRSLSTEHFIWLCTLELCIGIFVALFQRCGAVDMFTSLAERWARSRKRVGLLGWGLGMFIFFSDYFSTLLVGPVMRKLTDKYRISREKLAYICDSTSAPLVALMPITGWAVYSSGLAIGTGDIQDTQAAMDLFLHSIPFNFYSFLCLALVLLLAARAIPDFGPMRAAEERAYQTGKVSRDGAVPMMSRELTDLEASSSGKTSLLVNFLFPVLLIITTNLGSFFLTGRPIVMESFLLACTVLGLIMLAQRVDDLRGIMSAVYAGIKGVMPAVVILSLAYCINTLSREMGTAEYVVGATESWMSPLLIPVSAFLLSAFISFATGSAYGTYAIMVPIVVPLAYEFGNQEVGRLVFTSFGAVLGGGVFGDHCSPLSDTTVLSSMGSACDHIDHVKTQLPYAVSVAGIAMLLYLGVGLL
ncbi:MAG: Na+/H+ antiporter NhaC family protein [Acidobacteriota bacterium]